MNDSVNILAFMCVKRVAKSTTIREKQFHACDNSEIAMKTEMVLVHDSMHVNDNKHSKKSSKQHSHKQNHEKQLKC